MLVSLCTVAVQIGEESRTIVIIIIQPNITEQRFSVGRKGIKMYHDIMHTKHRHNFPFCSCPRMHYYTVEKLKVILSSWSGSCVVDVVFLRLVVLHWPQLQSTDWMGDLMYVQMTEDRSLLAGYVSMFLGEFNAAQDLFLASSRPVAALEVHITDAMSDYL